MMHPTRSIDGYMRSRGMPTQPVARPRLLPRVVEAASSRYRSIRPPDVTPVEYDGTQPGATIFANPIQVTPDYDAAIRIIRFMRDVKPRDCQFPDDMGCETQLYLGLAIRFAFPGWGMVKVAHACMVSGGDAIFFATLLDIAEKSDWVASHPEIITAAVGALAP